MTPPTSTASSPWPSLLITVLLTGFIAATYGFGIYLFSQLVTDMRADLGFDYRAVGLITAAGQLGFLLFAMAGAWLAPRLGGGVVVIGSVALCGACLLALPTTDDILIIGALLTVLGGAAASVWVPMVEIVARSIAYRHRGKVLGLASSGTSYGVFINSLLVPMFVINGNWRGVWVAVGAGTLAMTVFAVLVFWRLGLLRREPRSAPASGMPVGRTSLRTVIAPWVLIIWAMTLLNGLATLPFQNYLSPYLREELGLGVELAAWVWGAIGFIGMFAGFVVGWLADRTGVRAALLFAYTCLLLAALTLAIAPSGVLPMAAGVLFAIAFYPIFGLVPAYVAKTADGGTATVIFAVANVTLGIGGMSGNYLAGMAKNLSGTFVWTYVAVAVCAAALGVLTALLPREGAALADPLATAAP